MARKRKRLGHITEAERMDVQDALDGALMFCARNFKQGKAPHSHCVQGVSAFRYELQKKGLWQ
jgi:hypothetical protein